MLDSVVPIVCRKYSHLVFPRLGTLIQFTLEQKPDYTNFHLCIKDISVGVILLRAGKMGKENHSLPTEFFLFVL